MSESTMRWLFLLSILVLLVGVRMVRGEPIHLGDSKLVIFNYEIIAPKGDDK